MEAIETIAVSKAIDGKAAKAARAELEPGTYEVDVLVRVKGGLRVGEDYESSIVGKIKPLDLWLATLDLLAPQVTGALIDRIVKRALAEDDVSLRRFRDLKEKTADALKVVRSVTKTTCKGKVTHTLAAEAVNAEVVENRTRRIIVAR